MGSFDPTIWHWLGIGATVGAYGVSELLDRLPRRRSHQPERVHKYPKFCPKHGDVERIPVDTIEGEYVADLCMAKLDWGGTCFERLKPRMLRMPSREKPPRPPKGESGVTKGPDGRR